ncbi:MAG: hypothetical protein ACREMQ_10055 [Longimicrobiales bacterium]
MMKCFLRIASIAVLAIGCDSFDPVARPLTVAISAPKNNLAVNEIVSFRLEATGTSLNEVSVDFGDGTNESRGTAGAQTASANFPHQFSAAGTFHVVGFATEGGGTTVRDTVIVVVQ